MRVRLGLALVLVTLLAGPVHAQGDKRPGLLTWADAPVVPRYRTQADWLVDVGWKTSDQMYGPFPTREYRVGDAEQFILLGNFEPVPQMFVLAYQSEHAYFWFERSLHPDRDELEAAARFFEDRIWPLNTRIFGQVRTPGIDGDSRIHIVGQRFIAPGIFGAFRPEDQCPRALCPNSNQREIIYIALDQAPLGSDEFLMTLAHEHQHLIQFAVDGNERRWLNEGLSQLAEHFNGFDPFLVGGDHVSAFLQAPDHRLSGWSFEDYDPGRTYGAAYLFLVYLYERFGLDFIRHVAANDRDGLAAIQDVLRETGAATGGVDAVFADWILANLLDDPYVGDGRYYYQTLDLPAQISPAALSAAPGDTLVCSDAVNQYGADYWVLDGPGAYELSFDGADVADVIGAKPHSGAWMWWSYDGSNSAARLTAGFDLSGLDTVTLAFSAWWRVEDGADWFQVLVSDDGGERWEIVRGERASVGGTKAPGAYYSGRSGTWVDERIDLSAYAGQTVLVRFEYLTDGSRTLPGVALDDLGIVELGPLDDVERPASVWQPDGFIRIPDAVPQHWALAAVIQAPGQAAVVEHVPLDAQNTGRISLTVPQDGSATIVVGAMAPFTSNRASYKLSVRRTRAGGG